MYTSGTTGRPKGVELPPTMFAGGGTMREHVAALRPSPFAAFGTHLVVGPMYHTGPLSGVRLLAAGIPVVVLGRFDAEGVLRAIDTHRVETTVMVPTHFVRLLALPDDVKQRYDVSSLQLVTHTGASCPVDVKRQMIEWWGPVLQDAYGATEVGTTCTISSAEWLEHPGSVGRAVPPFSVLVVDDDGQEVPAGTEGRLYFEDATGRGIVYPGDPEKSAKAHLRPGVFTLGEIGYVTDDGFVYITDRFSDMIVSGGVNIYPAEAEQVLIEHPGVGRRRRHRRAPPGDGRGGEGARRARRSRPPAGGRRADRLVPRAAGRLQVLHARSTSSTPSAARRWASSTSASCAAPTGSSALVARRSRRQTPHANGRSGRDPCHMSDVRPHIAHRSSRRRALTSHPPAQLLRLGSEVGDGEHDADRRLGAV